MKFFKFCTLLCLSVGIGSANVVKPTLQGLTIAHAPFAMKSDAGVYSGYSVDLMNLIAEKAGFTFSLDLSPDGKYGMVNTSGFMNGMVGEVSRKNADFAVGDITITDTRKEFVDFSESIMESTLSAILKKEFVPEGATSMKDLLNSTSMTLITLAYGATAAAFKEGNDTLAQAFWKRINSTGVESGFVKSTQEGVDRVKSSSTPVAYISQISTLEYIAKRDCALGLTVLPDDAHIADNQFGIALQKNSPWLEPINEAIKGLKEAGKLDKLKAKYWVSSCASMNEALVQE